MFPTEDGNSGSKGDPAGLPDTVQLAVGMKVMVTYNIETELDVANGARGTVERIIVHDMDNREAGVQGHIQRLARPPVCVLVRLWRTKVKALLGLEQGVVPIIPIRNRFQVKLPSGKKISLWQEQLPLTPAYAFTDYCSQGQTIPDVIVDLATPPFGGRTPFNVYMALSRSRTTDQARLLRNLDSRLFTTPPDEHLAEEDARLERLNRDTEQSESGHIVWLCIY